MKTEQMIALILAPRESVSALMLVPRHALPSAPTLRRPLRPRRMQHEHVAQWSCAPLSDRFDALDLDFSDLVKCLVGVHGGLR